MNNLKNNIKNKIFFIGIGGISMSALATLAHSNGNIVGGSDISKSEILKNLEKKLTIYYGHSADNIIAFKPDLVVYTGAICKDNVELKLAKDMGIPCIERSEYLGQLCDNYKHVIAISGTHGKTTTTSMIGHIFNGARLNPTIHVGGVALNFKSNLVVGGNEYFITEACEYKKSFEHIKSDCGVVTNIECDHMDCYLDYNDLLSSFNTFLSKANICVLDKDNPLYKSISNKKVYTFSTNDSNFYAYNIKTNGTGYTFDVNENGKFLSEFRINIMGEYNVGNALIAIAVARIYEINVPTIYTALESFKGVLRRNELIGKIKDTPVYADYCHHPTEILNSINNFSKHFKNILCVFQPHTYSRTKTLFKDFLKCFNSAKVSKLIIYKTYPAREDYDEKGSETTLFNALKYKNKQLVMNTDDLEKSLKKVEDYDCIIVLGAGDVYDIVKKIVTK